MSNNQRVWWFCWWATSSIYYTVQTIACFSTNNTYGMCVSGLQAFMTGWCTTGYLDGEFMDYLEEKYAQ